MLVQQALVEHRAGDAAALLTQCVQQYEGTPALTSVQHARLLEGCSALIRQGPAADPNLWEKAQACLYAVLL